MASFYRINVFTKLDAFKEGVIWPEFSELNRPHLDEQVTGFIVPKTAADANGMVGSDFSGKNGQVTLKVVSIVHSVANRWTADATHVIEVELA